MLKIAFFGTPTLASELLKKLSSIFDIKAVVTQEDKEVGRKKVLTPSPVKQIAEEFGIKVFQPVTLRDENFISGFAKLDIDAVVVVDFGKIIPQVVLDLFPNKFVNVHFSLLPSFRGSCPVPFAIFRGKKISGVSLFVLERKMDTGPIISQKEIELSENEDRNSLLEKSYKKAFEILKDDLPKYISGKIIPVPQNDQLATFCNFQNSSSITTLLKNDDVQLDLEKSFIDLDRQIRAFRDWMDCWTILNGKKMKIFRIRKCYKDTPLALSRGENQNRSLRRDGSCSLFLNDRNELGSDKSIDLNKLLAGHLKVYPCFENKFGEIIEITEFQIEGKNRTRLGF